MKRNAPRILILLSLGCAGTKPATAPPEDRWAEEALSTLSLEEKIGQLIYPESDGVFLNASDPLFQTLLEAARAGRIGGVVFFKGDPFTTAALANRLQEESRLPLLMASDYEWGAAMRVDGATRFPRAMAMGAFATESDLELQAEVTAREARALGIHLLLNPVLDLSTDPDNAVDTRSFGDSPERVARLGAAYIRRAQSLGVLTTAKHFPGHGGTDVDSHVGLPVVRHDRDRLERESLVPFRAAIESEVAAIMPGHLAVPALDGNDARPATLSSAILEDFLRGEMGFRGLIVSDALDMGGVREGAWDGQVAVEALKAGVDLLLVPPDPLVTHRAVLLAVRRGELTEERIDRSVLRVLEAKEGLSLHRRRSVALNDLPRRLASPVFAQRVEDMAARAITLLRNDGALLPFRSEAPPSILLVDYLPASDRETDPDVLFSELRRRGGSVRRISVSASTAPFLEKEIESASEEVTLIASYERVRSYLGRGDVPEALTRASMRKLENGRAVVFASLGSPYLLAPPAEATALVAAYDFAPASQRALARSLFGEIGFSGKLPVSLSPEYPRDHGIVLAPRRMKLENAARSAEDAGFSEEGLTRIQAVVGRAIENGTAPGAVALVARRGKIVLERAFGRMTYEEDAPRVAPDTLFDIASLTKVVVTTTLAMILYERGALDLESPVVRYVPEFVGEGKDRVLVKDLLAHSGGLLWWTDFFRKFEGRTPEEAKRGYLSAIHEMPLDYPPRSKMVYTDLGILLLGEVLERVTGKDLETLAKEEVLEPLGMTQATYRPAASLRPRIAPTEVDSWRGRLVHGEVHDENAFGLGGVAPHAGLFATARDLGAFAQMMLNGGAYGGRRLLRPETISLFTKRANLVSGSSRALGWDTPSEPSSAGKLFSSSSYGHTGFTGTSLWIDPERELFAILLTNRVHPTRENSKIGELRPAFHDAVVEALSVADR
jgi:beta-glucosidase-like glycosyl hydrolase/CubicO group peptidase (beta-lactamase class C family)